MPFNLREDVDLKYMLRKSLFEKTYLDQRKLLCRSYHF